LVGGDGFESCARDDEPRLDLQIFPAVIASGDVSRAI